MTNNKDLLKIRKILKQNGYKRIDSHQEDTRTFEVYVNAKHKIIISILANSNQYYDVFR